MFQHEDLKRNEPLVLSVGSCTEVWDLFCACAAGDLETVERLVNRNPSFVRAHHEYRTPLYFAVRENRIHEDDRTAGVLRRCLADSRGTREAVMGWRSKFSYPEIAAMGIARSLTILATYGDLETAASLLTANPTLADNPEALAAAAENGHTPIVHYSCATGRDLPSASPLRQRRAS